jgi:hypothetical protein
MYITLMIAKITSINIMIDQFYCDEFVSNVMIRRDK